MSTFRKRYQKHVRFATSLQGDSKTQQHFARECDINHLMRKYQKTGLIDHVNKYQGNYADLTDVPNYHDALNKVISANDAFSTLPSSIRSKFQNNPALFLDFVSNPDNIDAMVDMGLATKKQPEPIPAKPEAVPAVPAGGELPA